jgi:hypothetical protein
LFTGILGFLGNRKEQKRQEKAQKSEQAALLAGERRAQEAQRDALRSGGSGRGQGDFRPDSPTGGGGGSFSSQLRSLTGR